MRMYRASGPTGAVGCGLALLFLGLFLITPLAVILIKAVGWALIVLGVLVAALGLLAWRKTRNRL